MCCFISKDWLILLETLCVFLSGWALQFKHARDSLQPLEIPFPQLDQRYSSGHLQSVSFMKTHVQIELTWASAWCLIMYRPFNKCSLESRIFKYLEYALVVSVCVWKRERDLIESWTECIWTLLTSPLDLRIQMKWWNTSGKCLFCLLCGSEWQRKSERVKERMQASMTVWRQKMNLDLQFFFFVTFI